MFECTALQPARLSQNIVSGTPYMPLALKVNLEEVFDFLPEVVQQKTLSLGGVPHETIVCMQNVPWTSKTKMRAYYHYPFFKDAPLKMIEKRTSIRAPKKVIDMFAYIPGANEILVEDQRTLTIHGDGGRTPSDTRLSSGGLDLTTAGRLVGKPVFTIGTEIVDSNPAHFCLTISLPLKEAHMTKGNGKTQLNILEEILSSSGRRSLTFETSSLDECIYIDGVPVSRKALLAQEKLLRKFSSSKTKKPTSSHPKQPVSRAKRKNIAPGRTRHSIDLLCQELDYAKGFEGWYRQSLKGFQRSDRKKRRDQHLYDFTELTHDKVRDQYGKVHIVNEKKVVVDTLRVRERGDLRGVYRYNVSGAENNCLIRCFALVNDQLAEKRGITTSRKSFIQYIKRHSRNKFVKTYLQRARKDDRVGRKTKNLNDYLNKYYNSNLCLQALPNTGQFNVVYPDAGFPIALAYISNVNLELYTFDRHQHTQKIINYNHPEGSEKTLRLLLTGNHYTILAMPNDTEETIEKMTRLEKENYYLTWCAHYGNALLKQWQIRQVTKDWNGHIGVRVHKQPYLYAQNQKGDLALFDPRCGLTYPIFSEDRVRTDYLLPKGYSSSKSDRLSESGF
ncbi:hypothetical protein AWC38_SpisGene25183 [Stylophora pistillata]|uniref:Uncharacterized protein n=1 Tax=Stylophora pistillata TaxID=50429 RepID=A0A2B4R341_STYPI|nr:hypothetical protein AWC38_SpisGene25183 [Stylophora pistillata]